MTIGQRTATGRHARLVFVGAFASLAMVAASCGSDSDATTDESTDVTSEAAETSTTADSAAETSVEIAGAWARTSPMAVDRGAAYMELLSADGDRLVSASVDASIAGAVEIHETVPVETDEDDSMSDETEDDGAMEGDDSGAMDQAMMMRELPDGLELPAGEVVSLAPGGLHIMFLDLPQPLVTGESFDLMLEFEKAGTQTVTVEILDAAP